MRTSLTKGSVLLLSVSVAALSRNGLAQTTASCLSSPSTVNCTEPIVSAGTSATITPSFPNPEPACEIVTNACAFDFAVPVASQQEWSSFLLSNFINTQGSCASLSPCETLPPTDGACAAITNYIHGAFNTYFGDTDRFGCASPAPAINEYQAPIQSGLHGPAAWILDIPSSTWQCPGTNGGSTASCSCREIGTAEILGVGPYATRGTFIWCQPL